MRQAVLIVARMLQYASQATISQHVLNWCVVSAILASVDNIMYVSTFVCRHSRQTARRKISLSLMMIELWCCPRA